MARFILFLVFRLALFFGDFVVSKSEEDYLEAIFNCADGGGHASTKEIADDLGVSPPSVTEMFQKLESEGFINYRRYRGVELTDEGERVARSVKATHDNIRKLLRILQVPEDKADEDACEIEHKLSDETVIQLEKFVKFLEMCPRDEPDWVDHFKEFSRSGEFPGECDEI